MISEKNFSLKNLNTFGLDVKAHSFVEIKTIKELKGALTNVKQERSPYLILGGGSNILLTTDFNGTVIKNAIHGRTIVEEWDEKINVKFGAGENWHNTVLFCLENGWGGVENLSLIPGTVGAAPMQNIGAYGVEICQVFDHLTALNIASGRLEKFNRSDCHFGYRESVFKNTKKDEYVIVDVTLTLTKSNHKINTSYGAIRDVLGKYQIVDPTIRDVSNAVIEIRQSKLPDPKEIGNAGSFFKNPSIDKIDYEGLKAEFPNIPGYEQPQDKVKVPAAWLIEQCGWKGYEKNGIGVHKNQALVLVNYGKGSGQDLKDLAFEIRKSVADKFGIELHPEVNMI